MRTAELQYDLPHELIAQHPTEPRDASRLMIVERATGRLTHAVFRDILMHLRPDDCLVLNDTRVIPARFFCRRQTGGAVEGLFLHEDARLGHAPAALTHSADASAVRSPAWRVLLKPSARLKVGERLRCEGHPTELVIVGRGERGEWSVRPDPPIDSLDLLSRIGRTPLPPYIRREAAAGAPAPPPNAQCTFPADSERYQTVYARSPGAVAAPTAGLHFTPALLEQVRELGVTRADVTLHVGPGTFAPIDVDDLARHQMHAEYFDAPAAAINAIARSNAAGGRTVAVGTTAARVLETIDKQPTTRGWTSIFIYPPYEWRRTNVLLTNFHLPGSTLLALVMAFAGVELTRAAYRAAVCERYRFFSYGDAMLII